MTDSEYKQLLRTFPRMIRETIEGRTMMIMLFVGFGVLIFVICRLFRLWAVISSAVLGPLIASIILISKPLSPYDNLWARIEGKLDKEFTGAPCARAAVEFLRSTRTSLYVAKIGLITALVLLSVFLAVAWFERPIDFSFDRSQDFAGILVDRFLLSVGSFSLQAVLVLKWVLSVMKQGTDS
jgi:hypothetical protein